MNHKQDLGRTISQLITFFSLRALIQKYLCRERGRFFCMFVDFKRAFDSIQHANLWHSLERKGISQNSKFFRVFQSMYSQLKSCVKRLKIPHKLIIGEMLWPL